jgi:AraC-like DNA-binding protein
MTFPPEVADKLFDSAAEAGIARDTLLAAAGIAAGSALSYPQLAALYEGAAKLTGDEAFGLHVGERTRPADYGLLGYATAHSDTLGEALSRLIALQAVWTEAVTLELAREAGVARLRYRPRAAMPAADRRHESEQMLAAILAFARGATGRDLRPVEVGFEHSAPGDEREHRRLFRCPIRFAAPATELVLAEAALALDIAGADPKLGALISAQAEVALAARQRSEPLLETVRAAVRSAVEGGRPLSLAGAARTLGLGPRTLQRRLRERGLGWRRLVDEVRIELARDLLADPRLGLAQIAFRAGFSQASAFHRAFRRLEGTTPRRYRLDLAGRQRR